MSECGCGGGGDASRSPGGDVSPLAGVDYLPGAAPQPVVQPAGVAPADEVGARRTRLSDEAHRRASIFWALVVALVLYVVIKEG